MKRTPNRSATGLGSGSLAYDHRAWKREVEGMAVLVDNTALVCQRDFLASKAAGLELADAHLALVSECESSHVAEDHERVARSVREAVDV